MVKVCDLERTGLVWDGMIILPIDWHMGNTFAFSIDLPKDGKIIPLYHVSRSIIGKITHMPFIRTIFRNCRISGAENLSWEWFTVSVEGRDIRLRRFRAEIDGRIIIVEDAFVNWLVFKATMYRDKPYAKFEDLVYRDMQKYRSFTMGNEHMDRLKIAWNASLAIALGAVRMEIPDRIVIPLTALPI